MGFINEFLNTGNNLEKLIWIVIGIILGVLIKDIILNNLLKAFRTILFWTVNRLKIIYSKIKELTRILVQKQKYKRTIKQIEKGKIEIPSFFLSGKSQENNPELRKIFRMIDEGIVEPPESYKLEKYFKENSIDVEKIMKSVDLTNQIRVEMLNLNDLLKDNKN